jgi:HEAT repeat protein
VTATSCGSSAKEAVAYLIAASRDQDEYVHRRAAFALKKIDPAAFSTELKISP